jgi:predicted RNA-binding protein YlxR (DUF448 family)
VGCRQVLPKRALIRVVRTPEGVFVDPTGKMPGRGAYLHNQRSCWDLGLKDHLERALKTTFSQADRDRLEVFAASVTETEGTAQTLE